VEGTLKPSTARGYRGTLGRLTKVYGDYDLMAINAGHLQKYLTTRSNEENLKPKTVCNQAVIIKELFKFAYEWGYTKVNPGQFLKRPKVPKHEIEILGPDEVNLFLKALEEQNNHYRIAFLTDIYTGLRSGELWALTWGDIDWQGKQIIVRRSVWKGQFQTPKSDYSVRKVDVPDELMHQFKLWKMACPVNEHNLLFPSREGKLSAHGNVVRRHFKPMLDIAGIKKVSFHSIRHTNVSLRIRANQNIKYIQQQLGHSSINITLDIYGHLFNDTNFARQQVELLTLSLGNLNY